MAKHEYDEQERKARINLWDDWEVIIKRKWIIISFALAVLTTVMIGTFTARPTYTAKGILQIEKEPNILTFQDIFQIDAFNDDYYQTQYKILESRTLAANTIERLKLRENEKFTGKLKKDLDKTDPAFREAMIDVFLGRLSVDPIRQTRLVEVSFKGPDPDFAARVLNELFDTFIDMSIQKKYSAAEQATEFLSKQIANVSAEIQDKEKRLQEYGARKNIVVLNDRETTIVEKLGGLNRALTEAQIERIAKETYYNQIKMATPDNIPEALNNSSLQKLREEYLRLNRESTRKAETFLPDFPEMKRLKAELDAAKESLGRETQRLIVAAYSDYQAAFRKEQSLADAFNQQKLEAARLNSDAILYNSLKVEIENNKNVLQSLLIRQGQTDVSAQLKGLGTSSVSIVDRAAPPRYPSSPKKKLNMLLALMIGLIGGLGLAFLFEHLDNSVKTYEDVEKYCRAPALGIIPRFGKDGRQALQEKVAQVENLVMRLLKKGTEQARVIPMVESIQLITQFSPNSLFSENYRSIRTTLLFSSAGSKTLAVSSPLPQEGKTATISNLAVSFAQADKQVLVIDADLRKPRLHAIFNIDNLNGLTDYLNGNIEIDESIKRIQKIPNLFLLNAGSVPPNPLELLGSEKMTYLVEYFKQFFDYILFDTPPLLPFSDAIILGQKIDGVILVAWGNKTPREALQQAKDKLDAHEIKCVGVILNSVNIKEHGSYYAHYHRYYGH
ncbi:MAG TPA: polysaccharide biosynthesis tyrosine autokinase [Candidatus Aminicenantes bacterium]|nr:polysaccharide biosynthesis tyrosine autokinase [Candidatus Aminicenantes bacterium]